MAAIEAFSDGPGRGSEFIVRLPCRDRVTPESPASAPAQPPAARSARVLVVDDNRDVAMTLAALLKHQGHAVQLAHDGPAALAMAAECRPDLVLVDIGLPGMDGYEVARKLRTLKGLDRAMLAALTGFGHEEHRRRSEEAGFDCHLVKPLKAEELLALLAKAPLERP
jgi:CheY-like chemotaxis protein